MSHDDLDRRAVARALERALAHRESGHPELLDQGLVGRLDQLVGAVRAGGRSEVQAIALLRRNPGLIRLH